MGPEGGKISEAELRSGSAVRDRGIDMPPGSRYGVLARIHPEEGS